MSEDADKERLVQATRDWAEKHMDQFETFWIDSKYGPVFVKMSRIVPSGERQLYYNWGGMKASS